MKLKISAFLLVLPLFVHEAVAQNIRLAPRSQASGANVSAVAGVETRLSPSLSAPVLSAGLTGALPSFTAPAIARKVQAAPAPASALLGVPQGTAVEAKSSPSGVVGFFKRIFKGKASQANDKPAAEALPPELLKAPENAGQEESAGWADASFRKLTGEKTAELPSEGVAAVPSAAAENGLAPSQARSPGEAASRVEAPALTAQAGRGRGFASLSHANQRRLYRFLELFGPLIGTGAAMGVLLLAGSVAPVWGLLAALVPVVYGVHAGSKQYHSFLDRYETYSLRAEPAPIAAEAPAERPVETPKAVENTPVPAAAGAAAAAKTPRSFKKLPVRARETGADALAALAREAQHRARSKSDDARLVKASIALDHAESKWVFVFHSRAKNKLIFVYEKRVRVRAAEKGFASQTLWYPRLKKAAGVERAYRELKARAHWFSPVKVELVSTWKSDPVYVFTDTRGRQVRVPARIGSDGALGLRP